jgi:hypothetical protein
VILAFAENKADMFISDKKKILEDEKTSRIKNVKVAHLSLNFIRCKYESLLLR